MAHYIEAFVGIDVAKLKNAIAVAEYGRDGEIRYFGEVEASDVSMRRVIQRIAAKFDRVHSAMRPAHALWPVGSSSQLATNALLLLRLCIARRSG